MIFNKPPFVFSFLVSLLLGSGHSALAQEYPSKPIKLIVIQAAGGTTDVIARAIGQKLGPGIGQAIVIENKPGAEGIIGAELTAKAEPDGYTVMLGSTGTHAANIALYKKLPYDPVADFTPVTLIGKSYYAVLVPPAASFNSIKELVGQAKAKPGLITYGTGGSSGRINIEIFKAASGADLRYIPYKDNNQALIDVIGGRLDLVFEALATATPQMKSGAAKTLAVTSPERLPQFPNVPTVAEAGYPGFEVSAWLGMYAPAGTPRPVQQKLNGEMLKVLKNQEVTDKFRTLGFEPLPTTPERLAAFTQSEIAGFKKIVRDVGIELR